MTKYGKYDKYGRVQEIRQLCDVPYKTTKINPQTQKS